MVLRLFWVSVRWTIIRRGWSELEEFLGLCSLHRQGQITRSTPGVVTHSLFVKRHLKAFFYTALMPNPEVLEMKG